MTMEFYPLTVFAVDRGPSAVVCIYLLPLNLNRLGVETSFAKAYCCLTLEKPVVCQGCQGDLDIAPGICAGYYRVYLPYSLESL